VRWVAGVCSGGATTWVAPTDLATLVATPTAFGAHQIGTMNAAVQRWLMLTMTLTTPNPVPGQSAQLRLQAWGVGGPLATGPGSLASTGPSDGSWFPPMTLGFAAIGIGLLVSTVARRRQEAQDD
jgi:hypothetical protein